MCHHHSQTKLKMPTSNSSLLVNYLIRGDHNSVSSYKSAALLPGEEREGRPFTKPLESQHECIKCTPRERRVGRSWTGYIRECLAVLLWLPQGYLYLTAFLWSCGQTIARLVVETLAASCHRKSEYKWRKEIVCKCTVVLFQEKSFLQSSQSCCYSVAVVVLYLRTSKHHSFPVSM